MLIEFIILRDSVLIICLSQLDWIESKAPVEWVEHPITVSTYRSRRCLSPEHRVSETCGSRNAAVTEMQSCRLGSVRFQMNRFVAVQSPVFHRSSIRNERVHTGFYNYPPLTHLQPITGWDSDAARFHLYNYGDAAISQSEDTALSTLHF